MSGIRGDVTVRVNAVQCCDVAVSRRCCRQSAELNKLRSEYAGLMKELTENNGKLQQEELQRKTLEVNYKQNVTQLEVLGEGAGCPAIQRAATSDGK